MPHFLCGFWRPILHLYASAENFSMNSLKTSLPNGKLSHLTCSSAYGDPGEPGFQRRQELGNDPSMQSQDGLSRLSADLSLTMCHALPRSPVVWVLSLSPLNKSSFQIQDGL